MGRERDGEHHMRATSPHEVGEKTKPHKGVRVFGAGGHTKGREREEELSIGLSMVSDYIEVTQFGVDIIIDLLRMTYFLSILVSMAGLDRTMIC